MLDLDGTLYVGEEPVAGAREAVGVLEASGLALRYVTNTTRMPRRAVVERMRTLGFLVEEDEVFTPAWAASRLIGDRSCLALVDESLQEDLGRARLTEDSPEVVLIGDMGEGFTYARLDAAFRCLMEGAELVALQKNRFWHSGDGLSLDAGPFVAALEYASEKRAVVVGKPEESFFRIALEDMGLEASEVAMVGDDAGEHVARRRGVDVVGRQCVHVAKQELIPGRAAVGVGDRHAYDVEEAGLAGPVRRGQAHPARQAVRQPGQGGA